ncbi:MAG: biotin--[acetyl-CoA-carboxylase] ligase [Candidatus Omnitrophota bacterium]|nr:biotin--[acetyl-CoA-carboxylase] ligase [Candidatus Omnitrophota bacterium]MDZ4242716.1 biotin--[acetyl-CoA-carboxylase] ligase [Candidatus Omnitrophota bacterium]
MQDQIIQFLKKSDSYLSGEEISRSLNVSRAGIWKYIQELREDGYDIVAVPHLGYRLLSCPDKLLPREIGYVLGTKVMGRHVHSHDAVSSTMDEAFRLGLQGAEEGTVVIAESQTKGRGRLGRSWVSPKGKGLYFSVILRPRLNPMDVPKLTLLCAVALREAVAASTGVQAAIKWPNDLLVNGRKLAGILTELNAEVERVKFVVVGFGINVNTSAAHLPPHSTSVTLESGQSAARVAVLQEVLRRLERWYFQASSEGFEAVLNKWKELSATIGRRVRISDSGGTVEGEALDLASDGGLVIRSDAGTLIKKMSGDVVQIG